MPANLFLLRLCLLCLLCLLWLKAEPESGADDVEVAGNADAVVLSRVIDVLREVFIENLDRANVKTIAHPPIDGPVVKHFVCDIH